MARFLAPTCAGICRFRDGLQSVDEAVDRGRLSARGVDKVLRLAWTIADLAGSDRPGRDELAIALAMRRGEQPGAARREVG